MKKGFISIILFMLVAFIVSMSIAWFVCDMKIERLRDEIVSLERIRQRERLEKILDAVNAWRHEVEKQAYALSSAENIRIYAQDSIGFSSGDVDSRLEASKEERELVRQGEYLSAKFANMSRQGMFDGAAMFYPNGGVMLPGIKIMGLNLSHRTMDLIRKAGREGEAAFDRMRWENGHLFMFYVLPILSGDDDAKPIGSLLLDINMDKAFKKFIALGSDGDLSSFVFVLGRENMAAIGMKGSELSITSLGESKFPDFTFGLRPSPVNNSEVYSIGGKTADLDWEVFIEAPVTMITAKIRDREIGILITGAVCAVCASILLTFLWAFWNARSHAARAAETKKLYDIVSAQKFLLDSVNVSLKAGIMLADKRGRIMVSNPAFAEMTGRKKIEPEESIAEIYQGKSAMILMEAMNGAALSGSEKVLEMLVSGRLYRVSLFPYTGRDDSIVDGGCVAVFTDITEFRKNANLARERRMSVTAALVKAIESVDPLLDGHSQKMLELAEKFARNLNFGESDAETLKLAALLSQIGKIFVPREIFAKKDSLSESEVAILRQIPVYSDRLLAELNLDLPVREVVSQMWQVSGGKLPASSADRLGLVLALINIFVAMTSERSWRRQISRDEAIACLLEKNEFPKKLIEIIGKE